MTILSSASGPTFRAHGKASRLTVDLVASPTAVSPSVEAETNGAATVNKNTAAGSLNGFEFIIDAPVLDYGFEIATADLLEQDGLRFVAKTGATGIGSVIVRNRLGASSIHSFEADAGPAVISYDLTGYGVGTVGEAGWDVITERLGDGGDVLYYNGATYTACAAEDGGIQRNAGCWGADWDFSGVAVSYLYGGFNGGGFLATPRHYVASNHYDPGNKVGNTLRFVANDGTIHTRTILAQTAGHTAGSTLENTVYDIGDMVMFLLSSPALPATVKTYPVAGDWLRTSSLVLDNEDGTGDYDVEFSYPTVFVNQDRGVFYATCNILFTDLSADYPQNTTNIDGEVVAKPIFSSRFNSGPQYQSDTDKRAPIRQGDSGSVMFFPMPDGSLAAVSLLTYSNSGPTFSKPILDALILEVDAQAGISTGYTVTVAPDPTAA